MGHTGVSWHSDKRQEAKGALTTSMLSSRPKEWRSSAASAPAARHGDGHQPWDTFCT